MEYTAEKGKYHASTKLVSKLTTDKSHTKAKIPDLTGFIEQNSYISSLYSSNLFYLNSLITEWNIKF